MGTARKVLDDKELSLALERLELLLEPDSQQVLEGLHFKAAKHLPELSHQLAQSPFKLKQRLELLKAAGFVYSSKRFPKGYSLNQLKCLKVKLQTGEVIKSL